jgi:hypothetical protein
MPAKKFEKYIPENLEEIKDNPYALKKEFDTVVKFINFDLSRFMKKGIYAGGRRGRRKLTRLRTVSLYLYRAIGKLHNERKEAMKEIKESFIFTDKNS